MKKLTFSFDLKKVWQMLLLAVLFVPCQKLMAQDADYLCFTAEEDEAYFQLYKYGNPTDVTLEYSTNGGSSWTDYTFTVAEVSTYGPVIWLQNAGDKVYFRNKSNSVTDFSTSAEDYYSFSIRNNKISVSGNVMSLVDKRCVTTTIQNYYCFARLFEYCTSITSAPKLPAIELKEGCYYRMFTGCNNLTNAPTLPARTLKSYCYYDMFQSCTSLSHVEVGFTEWVPSGTTDALRWWMNGVSQTGTFECPKDLDTSSRSNYIPDGWTISQYMPDYLCFTTEKAASICLEKQGSPTAVTIEYSKDGMKWNTLTLYNDVELQSGETLYLRNASETVTEFSKRYNNYYHFRLSSSDDSNRISASGNIMSLVDKSCNTKTIPCNYCFYELFSGNRNLTSAPKLPATTLAIECYENMFEDCTGLTEAPALPATSLSYACYSNMFSGCTGLVNAPELAATTLAEGCYRSMFQGCTGLTVAPELPATTLVRGCYENMFGDCTGLTEAPELPAPTLVEKCYYGMFDNCSNLRKVSVSFKEWFKLDENGATAGWLGDVAEEGEFICPPGLPKLTGSSSYIPKNWTVKAPDYLCFTANTTSSSRVSLSKVGSPADVALEYSKDASVWQPYTFGTEISLSPGASVYFRNPSRTPTAFSTDGANYYHFSVEGDVAASGNIMTLVEKSGSIKEIPDGYVGLFYGLFSGCTGLTAAPELPATTLANYCYEEMFKDCSSLNYIKVGFTQWHENATRDWVSGVAAMGAFEAPVELDKTKLGTSYIPESWHQLYYHQKTDPTYRTVGYTQDCWEDAINIGKYYSDAACTQELNPVQLITYAKFITTPVTANNGFTLKEDETYEGAQFNWAAETIYHNSDKDKNHLESGERHVEFTVYGTDVANARLKWTKNCGNSGYGECTITISVNNTTVHTVNQGNLQGLFAVPLEGLKQGDIVRFSVNLYNIQWKGDPMIAACLEYTSSNGGWNEAIIHHDAVEPTYETVGNIEYWEDGSTGKYYSDAACTQELNPIQIDTYKKLISDPVTAYSAGLKLRDITYEGMQFNWAAETTYDMWATGTRSVEFTVYGKDVDNARVKWTKNYDYEGYGRFTISIYVNGVSVYSVNQDNGEFLGGLFTVPLQDLKQGDVVKFEIKKPQEARLVDANPTIIACLEYTSSNGGFNPEIIITADDNWKNKGDDDPELTWKVTKGELKEGTEQTIKIWREKGEDAGLYPIHVSQEGTNPNDNIAFVDGVFRIIDAIHHEAVDPTYETVGYSQECWEDRTTGKYYSDAACTKELNPAQVITYAKFISNPVTASSGFTLKDETYEDVQFNWAAETTYPYGTTGTRSVEFTVFGTDVANARVKWTKNYNAAGYGSFIITVSVNGTQVYSINQGNNALGGLSAIPLPDLKSGDKVKFEVKKSKEASLGDANPTIIACLEYTSSNGGKGNVIVKADDNQKLMGEADPELTYTTYPADIELSGINLTRDEGEEAGEYAIRMSEDEGANPGYDIVYIEGKFTISKSTITITADDILKLVGEADPKLTWSVKGKLIEGHDLTGIKLCREAGEEIGHYTISISQENGANPCYDITFVDGIFRIIDTDFLLYHRASEATYQTFGYAQNCWENKITGQFYSDVLLENELNPAQVITYKKLISNPVTANSGFTFKDAATYDGVQFNWAAETSYNTYDTGTRYVEFTVYGTDVDNARLKWTKTYSDARYGIFNITVYVNGKQVYRIQNYGGADLFAVPLQGLKTGDIVRFEVQMTDRTWAGSPTITACLEYTSSNGGESMLITANQDPDHTENYYSTFWSSTDAYQVPEGVTAYTGKVEDSTSEPNTSVLKLTAIKDGIIPASQGVILKLTTNDNTETQKQFVITLTTKAGTWSGNNALTGTDEATTLGANQYALSLGQNGVGFYLWNGKEIGANKAYLTLSGSAGAKAFIFQFDDDPTGITSYDNDNDNENENLYNLNGMRVDENYKGIVIKNGKKVYQR